MYAGEAYQMGAPENVQREMIEQQLGFRDQLSTGARAGLVMRGEVTPPIPMRGGGRAGMPTREVMAEQNQLTAETTAALQEQYLGSMDKATFDIMEAQVYLQNVNLDRPTALQLPGVTGEGALRLGGMLEFAGAEAGGFARGDYDEMLKMLAPYELTGTTSQAMTSLLGVSRSLGIAPGKGMEPYLQGLAESGQISEAALSRIQRGAGVVGTTMAYAGRTPTWEQLQAAGATLEAGTPEWQLQLQTQAQEGTLPIVQAMGITPGSARAQAVTAGGQAPASPAAAQFEAQVASQLINYADVLNLTEKGLDAVVNGIVAELGTEGGRSLPQIMRSKMAEVGIGAEPFGYIAGTEQADQMLAMRPEDYQGATRFDMAMAMAGPVSQVNAYNPSRARGLQQRYVTMLEQGITPMAVGQISQIEQGQGAISSALGLPSGFSNFDQPFAAALSGGMSPRLYEQASGLMGFGMGQMGYSMMAGGFGIGPQMSNLFNAVGQAQGGGWGAPTGPALYQRQQVPGAPEGTMGIYGLNQLEMRGAEWDYMQASQARTMVPIEHELNEVIPTLQEFNTNMRALNKEMADYQAGYQARGVEQQKARLELSTRQSLETLALRERMFHEQTRFQRAEMEIGHGQFQTRAGWQREEMAADRQMAGYQYEFQQGELGRQIRLAGGRERARLLRQREYQEEMFSFAEGKRGRQESRFETETQWQEEGYERQRQHFEEMASMQQEMFDMQKRHIMERYAMEMGFLQEQMDHIGKMKEFQDKRRKLEEEMEDKRLEWRKTQAEQTKAYYEQIVFPYQESQWQWQAEIADAHAQYANWQIGVWDVLGETVTQMINKIVREIKEKYPDVDVQLLNWVNIDKKIGPTDAFDQKPPERPSVQPGGPLAQGQTQMVMPVRIVVGDQEMDAYMEGIVQTVTQGQANTQAWQVYQ
jgi:hypothetical protein